MDEATIIATAPLAISLYGEMKIENEWNTKNVVGDKAITVNIATYKMNLFDRRNSSIGILSFIVY